jgi:hypothetical protein
MFFLNVNFKRMFPSALAISSALFSTMAQAQVTSGGLTTPLAPAFGAGVTVVGSAIGTLQGTPFALPIIGVPKVIQFTAAGDIFQFNNLPASGTGSITGLTSVVNLIIDPGAVPISLNFNTLYDYDANALVLGQPGTRVTYNPTGTPTFSFDGFLYQVELNATQSSAEGSPTTLSNNTVTGSITNIGSTAPEPGTLAFLALGGTLVLVGRKKR